MSRIAIDKRKERKKVEREMILFDDELRENKNKNENENEREGA